MAYILSSNDKRTLSVIYNEVNKEIYGYGIVELKIETCERVIVFIAKNQRVKVLVTLEENNKFLKQLVDINLFNEFKNKFKSKVEESMGFKVISVMRDLDTEAKLAFTVLVIE